MVRQQIEEMKITALMCDECAVVVCGVLLLIIKRNQFNTKKQLQVEKEIVREVARGDKHHLRESLRIIKHKSVRRLFHSPN